jgi:hypothetical protein
MHTPRDEFDRLLESPSLIESELAQQLLREVEIPTLLHPVDSREAFVLSRHPFDAPDVYVPRGMRARAEAVLRDAWAESSLERSLAATPRQEKSDELEQQ